jgi:hypothetical protein
MTNTTSKFVKCEVTFDGWDWRNRVTIKSPTGKTISLTANWADTVSKEVQNLFTFLNDAWVSAKFGVGVQKTHFELSLGAMQELLSLSLSK